MDSARGLNAEPAVEGTGSNVLAEPYGMSRDADDESSILDPAGERPAQCLSQSQATCCVGGVQMCARLFGQCLPFCEVVLGSLLPLMRRRRLDMAA